MGILTKVMCEYELKEYLKLLLCAPAQLVVANLAVSVETM